MFYFFWSNDTLAFIAFLWSLDVNKKNPIHFTTEHKFMQHVYLAIYGEDIRAWNFIPHFDLEASQ